LNICFVDWVDELDNFIAGFDFVLLPDQVGTGLKNRTVRVLSAGCAVLGTPQAFEGIAVEPGVHALIASNWTDWLQSISNLVTDTQLREKLAASAPAAATVFDPVRVAGRWIDIYTAIPSISPAKRQGK